MNNKQKPFVIRQASPSDASAISQLIVPLVKEFVSYEYTVQGEKFMLDSITSASIKHHMSQSIDYIVAVIDEQVLAALAIKEQHHIYHFFVNKQFHRQGIGKALWDRWLMNRDDLREKNSSVTVNSSRFAVDFYRKLGFIQDSGLLEKNGITCYPMKFNLTKL